MIGAKAMSGARPNGELEPARYVQGERMIARADSGGIRERWLWGLRLLHDPTAMSPNGGGLRHGVIAVLIEAAKKAGLALSEREIRRRLQPPPGYEKKAPNGHPSSDFNT